VWWSSIIGGVCGAVIALAGALLTDAQRNRNQRNREHEAERMQYCMEFVLALDAAHGMLRDVARSPAQRLKRLDSANLAVHEAGVFAIRERLLMTGTADLVRIAETAFAQLIEIRNVVRVGADLQSADYHQSYHRFAEAIWQFRMTARTNLDQARLRPADLGRTSWSERESCHECSQAA
jgi:hypothetical protein